MTIENSLTLDEAVELARLTPDWKPAGDSSVRGYIESVEINLGHIDKKSVIDEQFNIVYFINVGRNDITLGSYTANNSSYLHSEREKVQKIRGAYDKAKQYADERKAIELTQARQLLNHLKVRAGETQ